MSVLDPVVMTPVRRVYRVNHYVDGQDVTKFVLAFSVSEAVYFLGVRDGSASASIVASPVYSTEVDQPHAKLEPTPSKVLPPYVPLFSPTEIEELGVHFTREEIAHVRSKLTPAEIADLRGKARRLSPEEVQHWKSELQTREHKYFYCHA